MGLRLGRVMIDKRDGKGEVVAIEFSYGFPCEGGDKMTRNNRYVQGGWGLVHCGRETSRGVAVDDAQVAIIDGFCYINTTSTVAR